MGVVPYQALPLLCFRIQLFAHAYTRVRKGEGESEKESKSLVSWTSVG